ncbi:DUF3472 domain-containing protein [Galbibacter sp. PAP.153]|uniref:DUF3472 domain-containing protein n=1 Tax=Galbibacter sp. PAP.153 TaxID=3104623 RepID=UPI003008E63A
MKTNKMQSFFYLFISLTTLWACHDDDKIIDVIDDEDLTLAITIPPGGNSWAVDDITKNETLISDQGIHNWTSLDTKIRTYFKVNATGELHVGLNAKAPEGTSTIKVTVGNITKEVVLDSTDYSLVNVGIFNITTPGYHFIEIQGKSKAGTYIGDINDIQIGGAATASGVTYVEDDFYWGRRGPSVHLTYTTPEDKDILWFYNEVTVPEGEDVVGSYFMANGFAEGYFGMQVNSESERRVLFSVWSPYDTQNPDEIPEDYKIILLGKGEGVHTGEFGNEGSGGQSYKIFNWKAGNTYKFLLKGEPSVNNSTDYTAYFFDPETNQWNLIASFRRPYTSTYLKRPHSFLENFVTSTGFMERMGQYGNQWIYDTNGNWTELTEAKFTADATARKGARFDYAGGAEENSFFMKNCGFFSENTTIDSFHTRNANGTAPSIDFSTLEEPSILEAPDYLDKTNWEVINFTSQAESGEGTNGLASLVLDNDYATYWHSCWSGCSQDYTYPHSLTIDTKEEQAVNGFLFVQRNGSRKVQDIEIQVSNDNVDWKSLGTFNLANTSSPQNIGLSQTETFRYFKIIAIAAIDGQQFAAIAELGAY